MPLGLVAFVLAYGYLPTDCGAPKADRGGFDGIGTLLLALTLAAYALAVTTGRGSFGVLNIVLLSAAGVGTGLFVLVEAKVASPLIRLSMFRRSTLSGSLVMSALVSTVMMATLVVGPFYLSRALGLDAALVGLTMSIGPIVSALSGVLAGRAVDRLGAPLMIIVGLIAMLAGSIALSAIPTAFGVAGYVAAIVVLTPGYQLFRAANNTAVMMDVGTEQRGVVSGMLNLSRNLGLITGASVMGAVFALGSPGVDVTTASADVVSGGMRLTFGVAAALLVVALVIGVAGRNVRSASGPSSTSARISR